MARGRQERVRLAVRELEEAGVIRGDWQLLGQRPGLRWLITLRQPEQGGGWWSAERALTTAEAEALVNGALTGYALAGGRPGPAPEPPEWVAALGPYELRQEAERLIGEDRLPAEELRRLVADYYSGEAEEPPEPGEPRAPRAAGDALLSALLEDAERRLGPLSDWRVTLDGGGEAVEAKCWGRLGFAWLRAEPRGGGKFDVGALRQEAQRGGAHDG